MIPRSMVTGKLEGAWRVVARSLPRRLLCSGYFLPDRVGTRMQSGAKTWLVQDFNEIDWVLQGLLEELRMTARS